MDHATATAIATAAPYNFVVDPFLDKHSEMLVVRLVEGGQPFSIHISQANPAAFVEIPARDAIPALDAIAATDDRPEIPAVAAQPAVVARTIAGQVAESEKAMLIASLESAQKMFAR